MPFKNAFLKAMVKQTSTRRDARSKQKTSHSSEEIDANQCPICFQTYNVIRKDTGEDWVKCTCGRWVSESCVDYDSVADASGTALEMVAGVLEGEAA